MKLHSILFLTVFLLCSGLPALAGQLQISDTQVEFGVMKEGPDAEKSVTLTNTSTTPATIANVSTSCACTTTKLSKTTLAPGETATMVITYHTFKYPGKFDKTVHIFSGSDAKTEDIIHILGHVDPMPMGVIAVAPRKVELGTLPAGKDKGISLTITNTGDAPLKVSAIKSKKLGKTYWQGELEIPAAQSKDVTIHITPAAGNFLDVINVDSDARNDIGAGYKIVVTGTAQ